MINFPKKNRGREKPTKRTDTSVQGIVKTQPGLVEIENPSFSTLGCSLYFVMTVEYTRMKQHKLSDDTTSQIRGGVMRQIPVNGNI